MKAIVEISKSKNYKENISIVDLFAGVGGFHYGVEAAAVKYNKGVKPILVSEIDEFCQFTYTKNHNAEVRGDINAIGLDDYNSDVDILTAGFPCQPFSNSGKKLGLSDPRGQFYYRIEEMIKHFKAKSFILENVPGIKTNGGGHYESRLSTKPTHIGSTMHFLEENLIQLKNYDIKWVEIDSSDVGSPQVRKRVYFIGIHKDFKAELDLSIHCSKKNNFMSIADEIVIPTLELTASQEKNLRSFMNVGPSYKNGMRRVGKAYMCKGGNVGQGYHAFGLVPTLTKIWARFLPIYFPTANELVPDIDLKDFIPNSEYGKGYFRRASVREVYKLQGFPKDFIPNDNITLAYAQAGNAVNSLVVERISEELFRNIFKE
jgi:DNA (cytosine-5)-methyltransferase 1